MADAVPESLIKLLRQLIDAIATTQAQIADLQARVTDLEKRLGDQDPQVVAMKEEISGLGAGLDATKTAVAALQGHTETLVGETGLASQLGDLNEIPALSEALSAAMPAPAEPAAAPAAPAEPANGDQHQAAAA